MSLSRAGPGQALPRRKAGIEGPTGYHLAASPARPAALDSAQTLAYLPVEAGATSAVIRKGTAKVVLAPT